MAITVRILNRDRELTLHLYRSPGEANHPNDLQGDLHVKGIKPRLLRKNPITDDVWILVLDLVKNHGPAVGTALVTIIVLWLKQRKGRRIEIERPGLKVKVTSPKELERTLTALHNYDELRLTLNNAKPVKPVVKKKTARKKRKET